MTKPKITDTSITVIPKLAAVLDATGLFPGEMLSDLLAPNLAGDSNTLWLTCHLGGAAVGFCFCDAEEFTDGTCGTCGHSRFILTSKAKAAAAPWLRLQRTALEPSAPKANRSAPDALARPVQILFRAPSPRD